MCALLRQLSYNVLIEKLHHSNDLFGFALTIDKDTPCTRYVSAFVGQALCRDANNTQMIYPRSQRAWWGETEKKKIKPTRTIQCQGGGSFGWRGWESLWKGLHPWMKVGGAGTPAGTFPKGKGKPTACLRDHLFPTYSKWVSTRSSANLQIRTCFFPGAKCTNNQMLFVFFYCPRAKINGNIWLSIFEPQDAKPDSWKNSRESITWLSGIKTFFFFFHSKPS